MLVLYTVLGMAVCADRYTSRSVSITAAAGRGVAGLVRDAERGENIIVERRGRAVAAVVSVDRFEQFEQMSADVTAAALVLARELTDTGNRTSLDDAMTTFGFDRAELETELDATSPADAWSK